MAKQTRENNQPMLYGTHYAIGGRTNLEDRVAARHIQTAGGLTLTVAMVADGIGGHNAGEVAAQLTINTVYEVLEASPIATPQQIPQALKRALEHANEVVYQAARADESKQGMGTTGTVVVVHNRCLYLAHVGDSRAYLVRNGRALQITQDHTWGREMLHRGVLSAQEIAKHPKTDELYSSIGYETAVHVDLGLYLQGDEPEAAARNHQGELLHPQDRLLLCSDGLVTTQPNTPKPYVSDQEIVHILERHGPDQAARLLVKKALSRAADDNVSAIVLELPGSKHKSTLLPRLLQSALILLVLSIIAIGIYFLFLSPSPDSGSNLVNAGEPSTGGAAPTTAQTTPLPTQANDPLPEGQKTQFTIRLDKGESQTEFIDIAQPITNVISLKELQHQSLNFTLFLTGTAQIKILSLAGDNAGNITEIWIDHGTFVIDNQNDQPIQISQALGKYIVVVHAKTIAAITYLPGNPFKFQVDCLAAGSADSACKIDELEIAPGSSSCAGGNTQCQHNGYETPAPIAYETYLSISTRIPTPTPLPTMTPSPTFTPTPPPTATRPPTMTPATTAEAPDIPLDPLFIESLNIVNNAISQARGVLDRFKLDQGEFECEQFEGYYDLVQRNRDATYDVSEAWVASYNDALDIFLQSNKDLYSTCEADAVVTDGQNFGTARVGVDISIKALDVILNAALNLE